MKTRVSVIGGGFSGLATSYYLLKEGFEVDLYEKSSRLGGLISTIQTPYGPAETAANSLILSENIESLVQELNVPTQRMKKSGRKRYILRGQPKQWPLTFFETLSMIFHLLLHWSKKSFFPKIHETLGMWGRKHFGKGATDYLLSPVMQGIYAGDIEKMSAHLMLKKMFEKKTSEAKTKKYRGMLAPMQGMGVLISALEWRIRSLGGRIHLNTNIDLQSLEGPIVICTNAHQAGDLFETMSPKLSSTLKNIEMVSIATVTVFYKSVGKPINGFGILVPRDQNLRVLGILANPSIFDNRGVLYNETWILGGARDPEVLKLSDDEIKALILSEREKILKDSSAEIEFLQITRWPMALPHYTEKLVEAHIMLNLEKKYYFVGNYISGIGLTKILDCAKTVVKKVMIDNLKPEKR